MSDARSRFVGALPRGASRAEVVELLGEPEADGGLSRGSRLLGYRDLTLQLFFTYDRLSFLGCYFDRGNPSETGWPGPIQIPPELRPGMTEKELLHWLEAQDLPWSQVTAAGDVQFYVLGGDVRFFANDGLLASIFIGCELPPMGRAELLEAGAQLASRRGLQNLTLGNLAEAVGHPKSWIAHHFKTKEQLRSAVDEHRQSGACAHLERRASSNPPT